ncbi:metallophosphoesterase [Pseudoruegeria sp. HB172150]|uniref:metallophosphoesterase family protein n=1 Tax=Pseudoruegeria sp. HB172150 TaxID=2721164 RepID=UPI001556366E|nr:metallophosphoesterase [Pseudoruegeria sp. HB172150]
MRRLAHLSDLHFGRTRPELLAPLTAAVARAEPQLVIVSGDLTQRARSHQFREARAFLDGLGVPWLSVPGNHDVPLYNLGERLVRPFRKYQKWISAQLEPAHVEADIAVVGCNTVDPQRHQRGKIRKSSVARICSVFETGPRDRLNILFAHHPFEQDATVDKSPMKRAEKALGRLSDCGAHVVLSGHLHRWRAGPFLRGAKMSGPIQVHSGTSLSSRLREEVNDFAIIDVDPDNVRVTRMMVGEDLGFAAGDVLDFRRETDGLTLQGAVPEGGAVRAGELVPFQAASEPAP